MLNVGYVRADSDDSDHISMLRDLTIFDSLYRTKIKSDERIRTLSLNSSNNIKLIKNELKNFIKILKKDKKNRQKLIDRNLKIEDEKRIFIFSFHCHSVNLNGKSKLHIQQGNSVEFSILNPLIEEISIYAYVLLICNSCEFVYSTKNKLFALNQTLLDNNYNEFFRLLSCKQSNTQSKFDNLQGLQILQDTTDVQILNLEEQKSKSNNSLIEYVDLTMKFKFTENKKINYPIVKLANKKFNFRTESDVNNILPSSLLANVLENIITTDKFITYQTLLLNLLEKLTTIQKYTKSSEPYLEVILNQKDEQYTDNQSSMTNWMSLQPYLSYLAFWESNNY